MHDRAVTDRPVARWVPVVDEHGRTHLEMRWSIAPTAASSANKPHAA